MKKQIVPLISIIALLFSLSSCGLRQPTVQEFESSDFGSYPENYEEILQSYINNTFFDPYSIRDLSITTPARKWYNVFGTLHYGYGGCLSLNAKNRMGAYVGKKTFDYLIRNGTTIIFQEGNSLCR